MDLVRDLLDKKIVDRNGREMGRVDRIVLRADEGAPPVVVALELGPAVLAGRIRPVFERWVAGLEHAFGVDEGRPLRIPIEKVTAINDYVTVDLAFGETPASTVEQRLRKAVGAIPGSS
jgi:sporulation protein YlmC with PRC-barrel domain